MGVIVNFPTEEAKTMMSPLARRGSHRDPITEVVQRNVSYFYERDWDQREPRGKSVYNIAKGVSKPMLNTLELVADRAGIPTWYLLLDLPSELLEDRGFADLVYAYANMTDDARTEFLKLAARFK